MGNDMEYMAQMKRGFNWEGDHSVDNHSERHCTPSGRFLGIGCAITYLWGKGFGAGVAVLDDDAVPEESAGRTWNFAKRLMTENFSNSWHSTLMSKIDAALSNLHHQIKNIKT